MCDKCRPIGDGRGVLYIFLPREKVEFIGLGFPDQAIERCKDSRSHWLPRRVQEVRFWDSNRQEFILDAIDYKWVDIHQSPMNPYLEGCDDFIAF